MSLRSTLSAYVVAVGRKLDPHYHGLATEIPELSPRDESYLNAVEAYTMTHKVAQWEYMRAIRDLAAREVPGDIVECGVWRGGNLILAGLLRQELGLKRQIWAFDTFAGMTAPTQHDTKSDGKLDVEGKFDALQKQQHNEWCYASREDVVQNFQHVVGSADGLRIVEGPVQETLNDPANLPDQIALLRLDTDFYDSTKAEMENLYPRLVPGGIMIIDDYGEWVGARKAVDEYFADQHVWLQRVTHSVRMMVKR